MRSYNLIIILRYRRHESEEHSSSLRMSNIVQLLVTTGYQSVVNHSWEVYKSDVLPGEVKELSPVNIRIEGEVSSGVEVAAGVAHPYVVAGIG